MAIPSVSFEFFPPRTIEASFRLWDTVQSLTPLNPRFISVTYGAGGVTRDLTRDAVSTLQKFSGQKVAAHLTCVDVTRDETLEIAKNFANAGVTDIVALRGDPPQRCSRFKAHPEGFQDTCELVSALTSITDFTIRVGAYPDTHPEADNQQADIDWLKRKFDAGATEALTQFFFESETFFRFRDACVKSGIDQPIVPGILPIENWAGAFKFARRCGTVIPNWLVCAFEKAVRDQHEDLLATAICTELCSELIEGGVESLHFYTLNRPELTQDVCRALGVQPKRHLQKVA